MPYTPLRPHLTEVKETRQPHKYAAMHIPDGMRHEACFSFRAMPNAPSTTDPCDVIPFLCDTFIPDDFISLILDKTKSYIDTKSWNTKWKLNKGDIYQFFAILYFMDYHKLPSKSDYWEDNKGLTPCSPVCIQRGMSFRKFQFIWRNIYAITPQENEPNVGDLNEDPTEDECREWMKKAAPFISLLNKVSKLVCRWPSFKLSVDEMMSRFKGRSAETYRMKQKPIACGYKFFAICCATTGFVWHLIPHGRVSNNKSTGHGVKEQFMRLVKSLPGQGDTRKKKYVVGADNYFTYPDVLTACREEGVAVVGTARARKGWPPAPIREVKDDRFNTVYFMKAKENYVIARWVDNNVVTMVTTFHDPTEAIKKCRRRPRTTTTNKRHVDQVWGPHARANVWIPVIIDDYNFFMLGVDLADQLIAYYRPDVRCLRTWMPLMLHWANCTRVNAYLAHKGVCAKSALSHKHFLLEWVRYLLARAHKSDVETSPRPVTRQRFVEVKKQYRKTVKRFRFQTKTGLDLPPERLHDPLRHKLVTVLKQNRCTYCRYKNLCDRRDRPDQPNTWTKVKRPRKICSECGYYLCNGVCFEEFHTPLHK